MFETQVKKATENLRSLFHQTPLQHSKYLSEKYGAKVYIKREDLTPVRSYKIRGAFNLISQLSDEEKSRGIVCASAGNHAQGVAFACKHFKVPGKVFMPVTTPAQKVEKTKIFGGEFIEVILVGDTFDEAYNLSKKCCEEQDSTFVPPFDHEKIIEGQATIGYEILEQLKTKHVENIDYIFLPVGGGGVSSGIAKLFTEKSPKTEIICTEPLGAPAFKESMDGGKVIELEKIDTFVDGAAVKQIGFKNFEILKKLIKHEVLLIPENRLCQTMMDFLFHEGIVLEPAGGLAIDALKDMKEEIKGKTVVCVLSGGNFDFERLPDVKERAMKHSGLKKYFILRMPQRPGALKDFLNLMGSEDDITRFEYLKKSARNFGSVLMGVETKNPDNFPILFGKMEKAGFEYQDVTDNQTLADFVILNRL